MNCELNHSLLEFFTSTYLQFCAKVHSLCFPKEILKVQLQTRSLTLGVALKKHRIPVEYFLPN